MFLDNKKNAKMKIILCLSFVSLFCFQAIGQDNIYPKASFRNSVTDVLYFNPGKEFQRPIEITVASYGGCYFLSFNMIQLPKPSLKLNSKPIRLVEIGELKER